MYDIEDIQDEKQGFVCDTDAKADWALKIIQKERAEVERLAKAIDDEIEMLKFKKQKIEEGLDSKIGYLKSKLYDYMKTCECRELKTCYKYKLPSGELVYNKESFKYERDDDKIIQWLTDNNKMEYIKVKPSVDWAELKKTEFVDKIDGVVRVEIPRKFEVK